MNSRCYIIVVINFSILNNSVKMKGLFIMSCWYNEPGKSMRHMLCYRSSVSRETDENKTAALETTRGRARAKHPPLREYN